VFLQALRIERHTNDDDSCDDDEEEDWCVDAADISCLSRCLPALGSLSLNSVTKDLDTVAALTQLMPGLAKLSVGGDVFKDEAAGLVAKLTSLRALDWGPSQITSVGLQALTALAHLDMLLQVACRGNFITSSSRQFIIEAVHHKL
jgi:hypothetical protein